MSNEKGRPGKDGLIQKTAFGSKPESTPLSVAFQAQVLAQRFALLPDTALAVAYLAFEQVRGAS